MGRLVQATFGAAAVLLCCGVAQAQTALPASNDGGTAVFAPRVLSAADARRYREIFHDERVGRFVHARGLIASLSDRSLMGYVEAEHYLSPHSGRTRAAELNRWLAQYGDLSIAERVRDLSERRTRRKGRIPAAPPLRWRGGGYEDEESPAPPLASEAARDVAQVEYDIAEKTVAAVQTRMDAGTANLHDLEDARSQLSERFIALQDVTFELERAQLGLLRSTGELEKWALGK